MSNDTTEAPSRLRSRIEELNRIEAEKAAAPTLATIAEMLDTMNQVARDLTAQSRAMAATARQMQATASRRMVGGIALALIVGTLAGAASAYVMKSRIGGVSIHDLSSRLR